MAKSINSNTKIWESLSETDPGRTKEITGKKYKGTSINPNYIYEKLTEVFGPCGEGWGFRIADSGYQQVQGDTANCLHWVQIEFWHSGKPEIIIPAYGSTPFSGQYQSGAFMDEDAPKKSLTDALTKAAQLIGTSADIFGGQWNDSKYVADLKKKYANGDQDNPEPTLTPAPALSKVDYPEIIRAAEKGTEADKTKITTAQGKLIYAKFMSAGFEKEQMKEWLSLKYGVESSKDLPRTCVDTIIKLSDAGDLKPLEDSDDDIPF
jgi:hypothetical protein